MDRPVVVGGSGDLDHAAERSRRAIDLLHPDEPIAAYRVAMSKKAASSTIAEFANVRFGQVEIAR